MHPFPLPLTRYGWAVATSVVAMLLALVVDRWIEGSPFSLFLAAVMLSAWYGGLGPGLVATIIGGAASAYLFLPPFASPEVATLTSAARLGIFVLVAVLISSLNARLRDAHRRAEAARVEAEAARRRLAFLAEASGVLSSSLDYGATLGAVARLAVPTLADWCVVDVLEPDGTLRRVAVAHADPTKHAPAGELQRRFAPGPDWGEHPVARVLRIGESTIIPDVSSDDLEVIGRDADHRRLLRELGMGSLMVVPMWVRERIVGAIMLVAGDSGRRYCDADLLLAEELARRAALAIENARLYGEAQQAIRVRDEFLGSASHELRTPLSHIKGFVSSLRQPDVEWDAETRDDFLGEIEREADRLAKLIGDLLDMSHIESGGLEQAERASARPADLVAGGLDRVRGLLEGHPLETDVPADLPELSVDASQIERVIANLVENAAKYSPPDSPIRLSVAVADGQLELGVEDEGPGIPTEELERVFEKFVRLRTERSPVAGTGLGLAICRRIVDAHGGAIHAENQPRGVRFVVRLPLAPVPTPGAA